MKKIRVAINGFGRIGRITARILLKKNNIELVAVNDLTDVATLAHLFKYDSVHRAYAGSVETENDQLKIDGHVIKVFAEEDPSNLHWKNENIDVVLECTGKFLDTKSATHHL